MRRTKLRKSRKHRRLNPFEQWLDHQLNDIFSLAFDVDVCDFQSINALAQAANLAHRTVQSLYRREGDLGKKHLSTIYKLCRAIGMNIRLFNQDMQEKFGVSPPRKMRLAG